ncbi:MAG: class I SAM-dependent methyltransferase [Bacteroidota bacterium]
MADTTSPAGAPGWFSTDAFWETSYTSMFPEQRFADADAELAAVVALTGETPRRVLDLACGPGRHAIAAARHGMTVVGIDRSAFLLAKARQLAAQHNVEVEWIHGDMRDTVPSTPFDLVLNLFTSFGYFKDDAENERVLTNAYQSLRSGGHLVIDVGGKEVLARIFSESTVEEIPEGLVVKRRWVTADWSRMENEWTFVRDGSVQSFQLAHWIYSGRELAQMLRRAGFADVCLFGSFEGAPYGPKATRLVAVAVKA